MHHNPFMPFTLRRLSFAAIFLPLCTATVACAAAASLVFWVLQFPHAYTVTPAAEVPSPTALPAPSPASSAALRLWGAQAIQAEVSIAQSARFQLLGIVARGSGDGSALMAVDGQPPQAYRVGQVVADGLVLQSLSPLQARLALAGSQAQAFTLTLPDPETPR